MIRVLILGLSFLLIMVYCGCGTSNSVLVTLGDEKITLHDFEDNGVKFNNGWDSCAASSLEDKERFLNLLINSKLKIKEARARGLEKDSAIVNEIDAYNVAVAQSVLIDTEIVKPGMRQLYDRRKQEIRASHILFRLSPKASPKDTAAAFDRAMSTIASLATTPFDTLAFNLSEDPSAKTNHGDLGFFSGGRMVQEFEDACYSLKPGEYTKKPVRTQFGYHIIKVTDRQKNPGSVHIEHILLRFNETMSDSAAIRDTAWMLYKQLKSGANFEELAKKYSQDPRSAMNGGDIGFFERERLQPKIAETFFGMQKDSVSEPMVFNYGIHIFKVTDKKPFPEYSEIEKDLKNQYQQMRYQSDYKKYTDRLRKQYQIRIDSAAVKSLISHLDTTKIAGNESWKDTLTAEQVTNILIHTTDRPWTVKDFINKVTTTDEYRNYALTPSNIWTLVTKLGDVVAMEQYARHAGERYPRLAQLQKEYEDGALLFRIEQDEVIKKVAVNDSILQEYYSKHANEYRWPARANFAEIYVPSDSMAKALYRKVFGKKDFLELAQQYTARPEYKEKKGVWGFQPFDYNELYLKASTMAIDSITPPFKYQTGWSIIKMLGKDSAQVKTFEEAMPEVSSAYQEVATKQREQEWLGELKKKYPVVIQKDVLAEAFKRKRIVQE